MKRHRTAGLVALGAGAATVAGAAGAVFRVVPDRLARSRNRVSRRPPYPASERARDLHRTLEVVDLHADSLLWGRDLLVRAAHSHVDVPRLIEGGIALEGLAVCTKVPRRANLDRNDDRTDDVTLLALAQRWPPATWRSLLARGALPCRTGADDGRPVRWPPDVDRLGGRSRVVPRPAADRTRDHRRIPDHRGRSRPRWRSGERGSVVRGRVPDDVADPLLRQRVRRIRPRRRQGRPHLDSAGSWSLGWRPAR